MQIVVENNSFAKKGSISFAEVLKLVRQRIMSQQNGGFFTLQNVLNAQGSIQEDSKKTTPPVPQNGAKPSNPVTVEDIPERADASTIKTIMDQGSKEDSNKTVAQTRKDPAENGANQTVQLPKDNVPTVQNRSNQMGIASSIKPSSGDHNASGQKKDSENADSVRSSDPESSRNERIELALQLKRDLVHDARILKQSDAQKQTSQLSSNDTSNVQRTTVNQNGAEASRFAQTNSASQKKETSDRNVQNSTVRETHHAVDLIQVRKNDRKNAPTENDTPIRQQNLTTIQTQPEDAKVQANSFSIPRHANSMDEQTNPSKLFTQSRSSRQENLTTVFSENQLKAKNHPIELKGEKETEHNQPLKKGSNQNIPKTSDTKPESESIEADMIKPAGHRIVLFAQQVRIESNGAKNVPSTRTDLSAAQSAVQPVAVLSAAQVRLIVENLSRYVEKVSSEATQFMHVKRELPETIKVTEPIKIETFKLTIAREIKQIDQEPLHVKTERIESAEQLKEALNNKLAKKAYEHEQPAVQHIRVEERNIDQMVLRVEREQSSDNLQTIVETIKQLRDTLTEKAEIQLSPPSLGKLEIELVKQQDRLTILMKVSTPEARELIENSSKELISRLSSLGFKVEQIEVRMNPRFEQEQTGEERQHNQQFEDQQQRQQKHQEGDEDDKSD